MSGLNFFNVPGFAIAEPAVRCDIVVLASLAGALDLLASDAFAPAFANSTRPDDYRWGRVHRVVLEHALGDIDPSFDVPPARGFFAPPLADLDGIPTEGGFETVDVAPPRGANHVRVADSDSFVFDACPTGRFVAWLGWFKVRAVTRLPGGESGIPGNPFYLNLLELYLENETFPLPTSPYAIRGKAYSIERYRPQAHSLPMGLAAVVRRDRLAARVQMRGPRKRLRPSPARLADQKKRRPGGSPLCIAVAMQFRMRLHDRAVSSRATDWKYVTGGTGSKISASRRARGRNFFVLHSGREDLNLRPPAPHV